jgi:peptidyl-prolyl cis-trans isomerase-like 3
MITKPREFLVLQDPIGFVDHGIMVSWYSFIDTSTIDAEACSQLLLKYIMSVTLHTNYGDVKVELYCEFVPKTAKNFLALGAAGYYDGTHFHRNIKGFMIQGGDPSNTGKGGQSVYGGKFEDEIVPQLKHSKRGVLSMANSGKNTNGSQFFITYKAHGHLNGKYTVFGHVIDGMEVLDKFERTPSDAADRPLQDIILEGVTIHANPFAE